jgi:hypothetical protein
MPNQNLTCEQKRYLIEAIQALPCDSSTPAPITIPDGFRSNKPPDDPNFDPENEVIFDPESEVIFDPESEVIFDRGQIFFPEDGQPNFDVFNNLYDSYGYKINVKLSRIDLVKLLYWSFKLDFFNQNPPPPDAGS